MKKYCVLLILLPVLAAAACVGASKSSTPLSPSVAGPIPGVDISAPAVVNPTVNARFNTNNQPITLVVQNASTNGVRPLSYTFEVAVDAGFTSKVFTRSGVPQDPSGRTSLTLPDQLAPERTYYWHARAEDGANTGPFSAPIAFDVYTPVIFQPPQLLAPINNVRVDSLRPKFSFTNAGRRGPVGPVSYLVELADSDAFVNKVSATVPEQASGETGVDPPQDLPAHMQLFWHARAFDAFTTGPWSVTQVFQTPDKPAPPPPPGGGGGGGGGGPVCTAQTVDCAKQIVFATANQYSNLTQVFHSDQQATDAAIELLRRTIWHLQQAGFQAARQRNPSGVISGDKLNIFIGGQWHVYDIFTLGFAGHATTVHFDEITGSNPVPDSGIPD